MKKILLAVIVLASFQSVFAEDKSSGCGIGWQVTSRQSLVSSSIRGTTNGIFGANTFAMTSGTSGCAKHDIVKKEAQGIHYVEANFNGLMIEMAQGNGAHLNALADVFGCEQETFNKAVQEKYESIYTNDSAPAQVYEGVLKQVKTNKKLAQVCSSVNA